METYLLMSVESWQNYSTMENPKSYIQQANQRART